MTKIIFAATNLTIALTSGAANIAADLFEVTVDGQKRAGIETPDLLNAILDKLAAGLMGKDDGTVDSEDAIAFVAANPHCSISDVAKHFEMEDRVAAHMMGELYVTDRIALSPNGGDEEEARFVSVDFAKQAAGGEAASSQVHESSAMPSVPAASEAPAQTDDAIIAFLRSDSRYALRTREAIAKHFGGFAAADDALTILDHLVAGGVVGTKNRRRDSVTLYYAIAEEAPAETATSDVEDLRAAVEDLRAAVQDTFSAEAGETLPTAADAPAAVSPELTADNVLTFLRSDPRYTLRTQEAVIKHFSGNTTDEVYDVVDELHNEDKIAAKTRRRDGAILFYAIAEAAGSTDAVTAAAVDTVGAAEAGETPTAVAPEMNVENVRSFISADPRYTSRTLRAIAKHFGVDSDWASLVLIGMVNDDDLTQVTRRRDNEPLFSLA